MDTPLNLPSVSIAIPVHNEANSIEKVVRSFLQNTYPNLLEILIADGGSTDGTQAIIEFLAQEDSRVRFLQNPKKIQSAACNIMLQECQGDIFLRADAHSDYASDYIEKCVEALLTKNASNVGGAQRFVAKSDFQAGVALASKSFLGSGGAKYRDPNYQGYADTVYLGCFWKKCLLAVNGFSTEGITNEDAELNQRLIQQNKQAIYIDPAILVWYYPRNSYYSLLIQYFQYGMGRCLTSTKHPLKSQLRGLLPFMVISTAILLLMVDLAFPGLGLPIELLFGIGLLLPFVESLRVTLKFKHEFCAEMWRGDRNNYPSCFSRWFCCGLTLLTIPFAHFAGYSYQLFLMTVAIIVGRINRSKRVSPNQNMPTTKNI
jgi:succinoglycan biosynthesis protein ExoA